MKLLVAAVIGLLVVLRTKRWRHRMAARPFTAKILAVLLAVAWIAATVTLLMLV